MNGDSFSLSALVSPELTTTHRLDFTTYFRLWKQRLDFVLADNDVDYVLTDNDVDYVLTDPKPPNPTPDSLRADVARHEKWLRDDFKARHIIFGALQEHVQMCHDGDCHNTAKSLIDALTALFEKPSMSKRMSKLRKYVDHKMGEGKSVNQHILEMGCMAFELECEGVKVPEELQAVMLMNSLPDSWRDTIGGLIVNIESDGSDGLGLDKVSRRLRDMGHAKKIMENTMSYSSKGRAAKRFNRNCFNCGRVGHRSADCEQLSWYLELLVRWVYGGSWAPRVCSVI